MGPSTNGFEFTQSKLYVSFITALLLNVRNGDPEMGLCDSRRIGLAASRGKVDPCQAAPASYCEIFFLSFFLFLFFFLFLTESPRFVTIPIDIITNSPFWINLLFPIL